MSLKVSRIFLCFGSILLLLQGYSQTVTPRPTLFDSLYQLDIEKVQILVDIDSILANKMTKEEQEATMRINDRSGTVIELPLDIQVRSKSRRRYCDFPPLKFDFKKGVLKDMGLDKQDDFKIVTHCLDSQYGIPTLLKEYMIYQLYRIITPLSLRTILFDIDYVDVGSHHILNTKAFMLESADGFAAKQNGTLCECLGTPKDSIDPYQFELVALFQYMIGNSDMSYLVERNINLIRCPDRPGLLPVAYDFDFAAIVNAPYVHPAVQDNKWLERSYLGFEQNAEILDMAKKRFIEKKEAILSYVENFEAIRRRERRSILTYIKNFYRNIESKRFRMPYVEAK